MTLQDIADNLWRATEQAKLLDDSPAKFNVLEALTEARSDLARYSEEMIATLDRVSDGLKEL